MATAQRENSLELFSRNFANSQADNVAGRTLGLPTVDAMIEQFEARKEQSEKIWSQGAFAQKASLIREKIWRWLFHISIDDRLQSLQQLRAELLIQNK